MNEDQNLSGQFDVVIIGGGQSGLATAYYLRRSHYSFVVLDAEKDPGGSWQHYWQSIRLFSPAKWSSLPGSIMAGGTMHYPAKDEVVDYLSDYETKFGLPVQRPVFVRDVQKRPEGFKVFTDRGIYLSRVVVCATGSFRNPLFPDIRQIAGFEGIIIHSSTYSQPAEFQGKRVGIVGEGNSGAQILSELSEGAETYWITKNSPDFLPDHVDGQYLFDAATQLYEAKKKGKGHVPPSLGDIVMVPSVKQARNRGALNALPAIDHFTKSGVILESGESLELDVVIFCTGFNPFIAYLKGLGIAMKHNKVSTYGTRSREMPGLWMVGFGSWTGFASATLVGVGRSAKQTAIEIQEYLN